jgi:hypothetical protein
MKRTSCLLTIAAALAGCGPRLTGELIAGRTVMITNGGDTALKVERIIANDHTNRSECVEKPGVELPPGRSYTTTFFYCEEVREVDVETDKGWREVGFD